jgi:hypothetical protein
LTPAKLALITGRAWTYPASNKRASRCADPSHLNRIPVRIPFPAPILLQPFAAWNAVIANELDGTKSGLGRILGRFHSNQISVGFKIDTRLDDTESREVFLLKAGGMLMPTEAHYLDDAYVKALPSLNFCNTLAGTAKTASSAANASRHNRLSLTFLLQVSFSWSRNAAGGGLQ